MNVNISKSILENRSGLSMFANCLDSHDILHDLNIPENLENVPVNSLSQSKIQIKNSLL